MKTERIAHLEQLCAQRGKSKVATCFEADYHNAALTAFAGLPLWERAARAMAFAIENQPVFAYEEDTIGGRVYHTNEQRAKEIDPELDYKSEPARVFAEQCPESVELFRRQLIGSESPGHITWCYDRILDMGVEGLCRQYEDALKTAKDREAAEFYQGVIILLDALLAFNDKHIEAYEKLGNRELAQRMAKVPRKPAENFREAVQAWFMQHIVVMKENPFGGNSPGRLDYFLWPYLEKDLRAGLCTLEEAKEIVSELFLRLDERLYNRDGWVEAIVVGGTCPDGSSAVNPLTYIMIQAIMELRITHPSVYVRMPENPPEDLVKLCAEYMLSGNNRAQMFNDPPMIEAMVKNGTPYEDAVNYVCGGCMEVSVQGKNSDFLYVGWQNAARMLEMSVTGGVTLLTGEKVEAWRANKGLAAYEDFESFYKDFIAESRRVTEIYLRKQDVFSEYAQKARPSYLISSMIDDCLERGRNMHAGGARYHDYGVTHIALPNTVDSLYAIKRAVFEDKICTAEELVTALKANFAGFERLQAQLRNLPKYGQDHKDVDALACRVMADFADMLLDFRTRWGGRGKPVILTFQYGPIAGGALGARADGTNAQQFIAHGVTPASTSMKDGVTAAIQSACKLPYDKMAGGASTMWDFDSSWINVPIMEAVLKAFLAQGGQIFQGNTTPLEELIDAVERPENHPDLIVRVGGYSARFINLNKGLQQDIICRLRHKN